MYRKPGAKGRAFRGQSDRWLAGSGGCEAAPCAGSPSVSLPCRAAPLQPKTRSAAGFHVVIWSFASRVTMASGEAWMIARSISLEFHGVSLIRFACPPKAQARIRWCEPAQPARRPPPAAGLVRSRVVEIRVMLCGVRPLAVRHRSYKPRLVWGDRRCGVRVSGSGQAATGIKATCGGRKGKRNPK